MQYIDLQPFEDFIRNRNLVDERHLPFYLKWVLRFLRSEFDREKLSSGDLLQCFSDQLARDERLEDWQRRQAVKAVELYLNVFLREQNVDATPSSRFSSMEGRGLPRPDGEDAVPPEREAQAIAPAKVADAGNVAQASRLPENERDARSTLDALREMKRKGVSPPNSLFCFSVPTEDRLLLDQPPEHNMKNSM